MTTPLDPKRVESLLLTYLRSRGFALNDQTQSAIKQSTQSINQPIERPTSDPKEDGEQQQDSNVGDLCMALSLNVHAAALASTLTNHPLTATPDHYRAMYAGLKTWIASLIDIYQSELRLVMWPFFLHTFILLYQRGFQADAQTFFGQHRSDQEMTHHAELVVIQSNQTDSNKFEMFIKTITQRKIEVTLSAYSLELLISFLESNGHVIGLEILLNHCFVKILSRRPWKAEQPMPESRLNNQSGNIDGADEAKEIKFGALEQIKKLQTLARDEIIHDIKQSIEGEMKDATDEVVAEPDAETKKRPRKSLGPTNKKQKTKADDAAKMSSDKVAEKQANEAIRVFKNVLVASAYELPKAVTTQQAVTTVRDLQARARLSSTQMPSAVAYTFLNTGRTLTSALLADDGSLAFMGSNDSIIRGFDVTQHSSNAAVDKQQFELCGHRSAVYGLHLNPTNSFLLSGGADAAVRLWHVETRDNLVCYRGHSSTVWSVKWNALGSHFVTASADRTARIWMTERVAPVRILVGHRDDVECAEWHPNCQYVATASADQTIRLFDVATGETMRVMSGHRAPITGLTFDPEGKSLFSCDTSGDWFEFDLSTSRVVQHQRQHEHLTSIAISHNSECVATGSMEGSVRVWSAKRGELQQPIMHVHTKNTPVASLKFTQRNLLLVAGAMIQNTEAE